MSEIKPDAAIATTPKPPYWAVILTNRRTGADGAGYDRTAQAMVDRAARQAGFLGVESLRDGDGVGITVSYWDSLEAIKAWRDQADHAQARAKGKSTWYAAYGLRIARVERDYFFERLA